MNRDIYCEECGKFLFKTSKSSDGAAATSFFLNTNYTNYKEP